MQQQPFINQPTRSLYTSEKQDVACTLALIADVREGHGSEQALAQLQEPDSSERAKVYGCLACMGRFIDEGKPYVSGDGWCTLRTDTLEEIKAAIAQNIPNQRLEPTEEQV